MENLVINFFWIWYLIKDCIICYVPTENRYLGKSSSWNMGRNVQGQSDSRLFKSTIFVEQSDEIAWFLHVDTNPWKLKYDWKILGWAWWKNGCGLSGHRTLKLAVSQEGIDKLICCVLIQAQKVESYFKDYWMGVVKNRHDFFVHGSLK